MKVECLLNGTTRIILIPENDLEKAIIESVSKGGIQGTLISQHTQILDRVVQDGLVISPQVSKTTSELPAE